MSEAFEAVAASLRGRVDEALDAALPARPDDDPMRLREAMRYAVLGGGKRMRPIVALAACRAAGGSDEDGLPAACAIELVHAYSLVHDDLPAMDDDTERRGRPTVHVAFGEGPAILVGDALLTRAFGLLAEAGRTRPKARAAEAVARLAHWAGIDGMVGGQALDLALGQDVGDLETLERIHLLKTGGLYAAAAAMGGLMAGADDGVVESLDAWGRAFGVAFQHADDVLDGDQPRLRARARTRVGELVEACHRIADGFGEDGELLANIAQWVADRMERALAGEDLD
ncbi:MAG: polyprenyl synthetase family protein [Deltaproteobacteria bacterium]|nr:MAG: polyprenyl synthetase family protein [Deltaproteobacteria bacterium]